ncbi:F-box protein PP2-A15-like isoform X2 [Telopea speciosissima]|uniref:F-box protein PP2-A15-like isoform X2 n=1 Tax=Telopea speciosissima TaxID=54955 RepID=UPI001CC3EAC2|nr:F-box protein PP2-A15-like isoform X2 [Telopea speciosissima]
MGATLSNLTEGANGSGNGPGLGDIPESCVACVFMYLTPPEICNLARLNRAFRGAASSDAVWESKLPPNYQNLLDLLPFKRHQNLSKKDIFSLLSRPIPFDDGNKEVWVDRVTGGVCMSISAKALSITGIEDRRYWNWIPTEESRFHVVAFLQQIWWFELDGLVKFPFPADGQRAACECCLDDESEKDDANSNHKRGCWIEYKVGEFTVSDSEDATEVRFSMKQIDCTHSKGGLCVDSVSIIPSNLRARRKRF